MALLPSNERAFQSPRRKPMNPNTLLANPEKLQKHMFLTYTNLRVGVALIAFVFPVLLWGGGEWLKIPLQDSMSAYYHATVDGQSMRNWFVGILFAVGAILYLYKGYSPQESLALNVAGAAAIGIAIFPMEWDCVDECKITMHGISAVLFFLSVAYVCIFCASDTLLLMKDGVREKRFRMYYRLIGTGLILSPIIAAVLTLLREPILGVSLPKESDPFQSYTFFAEAVGIWMFASYWLLKSWEISSTNAEHLALEKMIKA
jgi:hypothetical protein